MSTAERKRAPRGTGRESLIEAAVTVVGLHGLEGATVRRIAEEAGVHNTLITHYFGSREGLLIEAAGTVFERVEEIVDVSIDLALDPQARDSLLAEVGSSPLNQVFLYEMVLAPRRLPELQRGVSKLYDTYIERTRDSLRAHGFPNDEPLARAVFAAIDGLVLQRVSTASAAETAAALARLGDVIRIFGESQRTT